jgi:hypothetical protein
VTAHYLEHEFYDSRSPQVFCRTSPSISTRGCFHFAAGRRIVAGENWFGEQKSMLRKQCSHHGLVELSALRKLPMVRDPKGGSGGCLPWAHKKPPVVFISRVLRHSSEVMSMACWHPTTPAKQRRWSTEPITEF